MPTCVFTLCAWQLGRRMPAGAVMLQVEVAPKQQQPQQPDAAAAVACAASWCGRAEPRARRCS